MRLNLREWPDGAGFVADARPARKPDIGAAIAHLRAHARARSCGQCAHYVRQALDAGGFVVHPVADAKNYAPALESAGFEPVARAEEAPARFPPPGYEPLPGDIGIIQPYATGNPSGHMTMYDGRQWICDFRQRTFYPGPGYRKARPGFVIYRYRQA